MRRSKPSKRGRAAAIRTANSSTGAVRITGGRFRGRKLVYPHRDGTRPMKHRVREAMFNLVGPSVKEKHAIDLFAGTGALGLDAISRGARSATFIERHIPTAKHLAENVKALSVDALTEIVTASTFLWIQRPQSLPETPWLVFCCPPYDFYEDSLGEMLALISELLQQAPPESVIVVESDARFDVEELPSGGTWDTRRYPPAVLSILRK